MSTQFRKIAVHGVSFGRWTRTIASRGGFAGAQGPKRRPRRLRIENLEGRTLLAAGIINTVAGNYNLGAGYLGDTGQATLAQLNAPTGVAVDGKGDLFIADFENNVVREVNLSSGIISTVAGNYNFGSGYTGDTGQATLAQLNEPTGVAVYGNDLFIADSGNNVVREVNLSTGIINTVAGNYNLGAGYAGDTGQATLAQLSGPTSVAVDGKGDLFIADEGNNVVREVKLSTGIISTVAGNYNFGSGYTGDTGQATLAQLNAPAGVAVDDKGDLFIADDWNNVVREVNLSTGIINTVAGNYNLGAGYAGDTGQATLAELNSPSNVAVDGNGDLFITDGDFSFLSNSENNVVREVNLSTGIINTVAGNYNLGAGYAGDTGQATLAQLNEPTAVAVDGKGDLFIADEGNNVVREVSLQVVDPASPVNTTVAVNSSQVSSTYGQAVTFTATVTPDSGTFDNGGTVQFFVDGKSIGTASSTSGFAIPDSNLTAGPHTVTAKYLGDTDFQASPVSPGLQQSVAKADLTVTAEPQTMPMGGPMPTLTYTFTGFVNGDTQSVVSGTPVLSTTATATSVPGSYPITVTGAGTLSAANYDFPTADFVGNTLTVRPANGPATAGLTANSTGKGLTVTATVTDMYSANANANIAGAEYFIDSQGVNGMGARMSAAHKKFNSSSVNVTATLSKAIIKSLSVGQHTLYVHGMDASGTWGSFATLTFLKAPTGQVSMVAAAAGAARRTTVTASDATSGNGDVLTTVTKNAFGAAVGQATPAAVDAAHAALTSSSDSAPRSQASSHPASRRASDSGETDLDTLLAKASLSKKNKQPLQSVAKMLSAQRK